MKSLACRWFACGAGLLLAFAASGQGFPSRPVRLIVPFPPGGAMDVVGRALAPTAGDLLGQPVLVENRPGAGTMLGVSACAKSAPDGYTVCLASPDSLSYARHLYTSIAYDPDNDFAAITNLVFTRGVVYASQDAPFSSFAEMVAYARANPGKANFATWGAGTIPHLLMEWFGRRLGAQFTQVPYKGGAPANQALLSGEAQVGYFALGPLIPLFKSGKLKALALTAPSRSPAMPDLPTLAEAGADTGLPSYIGLYAPAKTPAAVIDRLHAAFVAALRAPKVSEPLRQQQFELVGNSHADFTRFMKEDREAAARVFGQLGIKPMDAPN